MLKVFIVPSWYPTNENENSGIFFKEQAKALQNCGVNVAVAFPEILSMRKFKLKNARIMYKKSEENSLLTYRIKGYNYFPKLKNSYRLIYYNRLKKMLNDYINEHGKPDLIHAHSVLWGGWASAKISQKYNIPFVITEHSSAYGRKLIKPFQKPFIIETLQSANKIITVGAGLKNELGEFTDKNEIEIIPNIVELNNEFVEKNDNNKFRIFSLGFLNKNKGMHTLIKAFSNGFKGKNAELIIGGDGAERINLESLAKKLNIDNQVTFLGALSRKEVKYEMRKCDVFTLASKYETFGVVYIEALASGKPIVATKCGGPESIVTKDNGLLCNVDDHNDLKMKLLYVYNNIDYYNSETIIKDCISRYSGESVSKSIIKVYEKVLNIN